VFTPANQFLIARKEHGDSRLGMTPMKKLLLVALACAGLLSGCISVDRRDDYHEHRRDRYEACRQYHDAEYCDRWRG